MQTVLYCSVMMLQILFTMCRQVYATISCITCNFSALNIINRKKAGGDVMGSYSHLFPVGISAFYFS